MIQQKTTLYSHLTSSLLIAH